ncbi:olfactory receptor 13C4-like [Latimeria chalumnae]|uniref:olfactory receptor 13C4-like n=1 Tax=Latimeria chalumnae TaxID=7897 RepID=UPI00313A80E6
MTLEQMREKDMADLPSDLRLVRPWIFKDKNGQWWATYLDRESAQDMCCYLIIVFINIILFLVIVREESLHEPMYIFIGNLAINGLYGSTAILPKLIADLVSEKQTISHVGCVAQVFFLYTFAAFEFYTLGLMAFDRYVAICNPLRFVNVTNGLVPAVFILFSYLFIIKTSVQASKEARGKAMQTCAPHLLSFLNYIVAATFEITQRNEAVVIMEKELEALSPVHEKEFSLRVI